VGLPGEIGNKDEEKTTCREKKGSEEGGEKEEIDFFGRSAMRSKNAFFNN
jgi:hypothetical protein